MTFAPLAKWIRHCRIDSTCQSDLSDSDDDLPPSPPNQRSLPRQIFQPSKVSNTHAHSVGSSSHRQRRRRRLQRSKQHGPSPIKYPRHSAVLPPPVTGSPANLSPSKPIKLSLRKQDREDFLSTANPRVQALVNQPFGKENLLQWENFDYWSNFKKNLLEKR